MYSICPVMLLLSRSASFLTLSNNSGSNFIDVGCLLLSIMIISLCVILSGM